MNKSDDFNSNRFKCPICLEEIETNNIIKLNCDHVFCKECIKKLCEEKITSQMLNEITCAQENCNKPINYYIIKTLISKEDFEKYDGILLNQMEVKNEQNQQNEKKEKKVVCPSCENVNFFIWENAEYFTCPKCNKKFCAQEKCYGLWEEHEKITCEQYYKKRQNDNEKLFQELLKKEGWKLCPVCHATIEKAKGCYLMKCESQKCQKKVSFCYLCGEQVKDHDKHFPNGIFKECIKMNNNGNMNDVIINIKKEEKVKNKEEKQPVKNSDMNSNQNDGSCWSTLCSCLRRKPNEKDSNKAKKSNGDTHYGDEDLEKPLMDNEENKDK